MQDQDFDMVVEYGKWNVEVIDTYQCQSAVFKSRPNRWFSKYYSGIAVIDDVTFSIERNSNGIFLYANKSNIGRIDVTSFSFYGREAIIILNEQNYILRRESLAQKFEVLDKERDVVIEITGILDKKKQANLLGLIYLPSKLLYTVHCKKEFQVSTTIMFLLLVCGYSTELFSEIDKGE